MPWPVLFFVIGLVFSIGFWLGHRFGFQEGCHAHDLAGEQMLSDRELIHLESLSVEALHRDARVRSPGMTLSRPLRSRAKSA
jgi:hypothetical protein